MNTTRSRPEIGPSAAFTVISLAKLGSDTLVPIGVLLLDLHEDRLFTRFRPDLLDVVDPEAQDILAATEAHFMEIAADRGAAGLLDWLESTLSGYIRVTDREIIPAPTDPSEWKRKLDELYLLNVRSTENSV